MKKERKRNKERRKERKKEEKKDRPKKETIGVTCCQWLVIALEGNPSKPSEPSYV